AKNSPPAAKPRPEFSDADPHRAPVVSATSAMRPARTPALGNLARHSTFGLESRSLHEPLPVHVTTAVNPKVECRAAFDDLTRLYEDTARFGSFSRRQRGSWSANQHCGVETTGHISATDVFRQVDVPMIYSLSPPPGSRLPQLDLDAEAIDRID